MFLDKEENSFSPGAIQVIFHPMKLQENKYISLFISPLKSFHPSLLSRKPPTFAFYEAPKKNRVKGF